jgi:tRNA A-37 threonylcarbamoyl transferase component Bud32
VPEVTARLASALADRYKIERELGQGGMASVYLAQDLKHHRQVAIKVLKPELAAVLGAERFVQEITTTAQLQHPHILPLFDSGSADGFLYYVMPYIEGETLRDKLDRETQLGIDEAVKITTEVADALDYAHRHGVIHRDIKPENILLHDSRPMVADFGIALALSAAAGGRMTETGMSLGTPHYMSPEQATAEKEITARSDVYSLGSVLYEMLAGQPPHLGGSAQQIIMKIIAEPVPAVTAFRKSVPPNVAAAVAKALEKLPADRFESAKAFSEALLNPAFTLAGTGPAAQAAGGGRVGVSRRLFGAVAALAAVLLAATVMLVLRREPAPRIARYSVVLPLTPVDILTGTGATGRFVITPDGNRLVYLGRDSKLWVRPLDDLQARTLEGTDNAFTPFSSPDGTHIGFLALGRGGGVEIRTISLAGGGPRTVADSGIGFYGATWGSDGYIYTSSATLSTTGIVRVPAGGGKRPEPVTVLDRGAGETSHINPVALPGGKGILFTVQHGGVATTNEIAAAVPGSGKHTILVRGTAARYASSGHLLYVTSDGNLMAAPFDQNRLTMTGTTFALFPLAAVGAWSDADLTLSSNGTLWYATRSNTIRVEPMWVGRDGKATAIQPGWVGDVRYPELSPDGARVAFSVADGDAMQLWVKQLDRGNQTIFTREGEVNFRPSWSPDGRSIAFISNRGSKYDIWVKPADQSAQPRLLLPRAPAFPIWEVAYPRSGPWVVFRAENHGSDLYAMRPGVDSAATLLVGTEADERMPTLSPDGRRLAYVSNATGRAEIYVRPFPDVNAAVWQVSTTGGSEPRWAHSGRELFFRNPANEMMATPITPGPTFEWGEPRVLFSAAGYSRADNGRTYDVAPGDRRFLMLRIVPDTTTSEVVVVENFLQELRAKVPR